MTTNKPIALYADGGVIGANPSPIGGTWAWCLVDARGQRVCEYSGTLLATPELPFVTNNVTELVALVNGLEALPHGWSGTVYSDSWVSLQRVFLAAKLKNVPGWLVDRLQALQSSRKLASMSYVLLDGHPTKAQLTAGVGKRGAPVSVHNVWADTECQRRAREVVR